MSCIRPATPGFVITLCATVILAVVVFSVPYLKSVYFLQASIDYQGVSGNITFGTLGYCVELSGNTTCSTPSIGYQLDINGLVGNSFPVQIPQVVVKWITYLLFLHVVALAAAAGSAVFGLLAHVREMSMVCCSTCFSGLAAVVTLIAFIFDIVLFFVAKARINAIGHAQIGSAIWLTLTAWVLLFFSGCFFTLGRCCIKGRPGAGGGGWLGGGRRDADGDPNKNYADQMRLDAVKTEADRKARQKQGEVGLPAFYETQPLTGHVEGDQVYVDGENNHSKPDLAFHPPSRQQSTNFKGGYAPGPTGSRSMDDYYHNNNPASMGYPPQRAVRRQQSEYSTSSIPATSASPPIGYASGYVQYNAPASTSPPPANNQLLVPPGQYQQYNNTTTPDPYGREYGHTAGGTSYQTALSHDQGPSYAQPYEAMNDPYAAYPQHQAQHLAQSPYPDPYMPTFVSHTPMLQADASHYPAMSASPPPIHHPQPSYGERSYTLGGDGYGGNQLPPLPEHVAAPPADAGAPSYQSHEQVYHQLPPIDTKVDTGYIMGQSLQTSPVKLPTPGPNEAPPGYEPSPSGVVGNWGKR